MNRTVGASGKRLTDRSSPKVGVSQPNLTGLQKHWNRGCPEGFHSHAGIQRFDKRVHGPILSRIGPFGAFRRRPQSPCLLVGHPSGCEVASASSGSPREPCFHPCLKKHPPIKIDSTGAAHCTPRSQTSGIPISRRVRDPAANPGGCGESIITWYAPLRAGGYRWRFAVLSHASFGGC
jgi:hypothetical protein